MRTLLILLLVAAAVRPSEARADSVSQILERMKSRVDKAEKLSDGKTAQQKHQLKDELKAMRADLERALAILATPTVWPPVLSPPSPAPRR